MFWNSIVFSGGGQCPSVTRLMHHRARHAADERTGPSSLFFAPNWCTDRGGVHTDVAYLPPSGRRTARRVQLQECQEIPKGPKPSSITSPCLTLRSKVLKLWYRVRQSSSPLCNPTGSCCLWLSHSIRQFKHWVSQHKITKHWVQQHKIILNIGCHTAYGT